MVPTQGGSAAEERRGGGPEPERTEGPVKLAAAIRRAIRDYPDFPRPGILFRDIVPVLGDPGLLARVTRALAAEARCADADLVVGIESRGFLLATPVALDLELPFVPIRKQGKLPGATIAMEYELEYGRAHLELQRDRIAPGQRAMLIDDLLATGGTAAAAARLVERLGGKVVAVGVLVELSALEGRAVLSKYNVLSLLSL